MRYIAALVLASTLSASEAPATIIVTNNAGPRNDFHITFNSPPGPLKQTLTGDPFKPSPTDPNTVVSSGWKVNGLGADKNTLTIDGLDIYNIGHKGLRDSHVVKWCFSLDNVCKDDDLPPTVKYKKIDYTLEQLHAAGFQIYSVPEPTSWLMMMCGFGTLGLMLRRRDRVIASACTP